MEGDDDLNVPKRCQTRRLGSRWGFFFSPSYLSILTNVLQHIYMAGYLCRSPLTTTYICSTIRRRRRWNGFETASRTVHHHHTYVAPKDDEKGLDTYMYILVVLILCLFCALSIKSKLKWLLDVLNVLILCLFHWLNLRLTWNSCLISLVCLFRLYWLNLRLNNCLMFLVALIVLLKHPLIIAIT